MRRSGSGKAEFRVNARQLLLGQSFESLNELPDVPVHAVVGPARHDLEP